MKFDYNEEQQLLADSVVRFIAQDYSFEARKKIVASSQGYSEEVWSTLAGIGLTGLPFSPDYGGFGGSAVDMFSLMEAMGDGLLVEPYLSTVGLGAQFVARGGNEEQKQRVLPAVVEGRLKMAFAQSEEGARFDLGHVATRAKKSGAGYVIDGVKRVVLHGPSADLLVVSARTSGGDGDRSGISLFLVDAKAPGVSMKACRTLDEMRAADIAFKSVTVGADALIGKEGEALALIEEVTDFATALVCAEAVGAMKYANDATLEYLKTRKQFGVAIGAFQALQHRMVDMVIATSRRSRWRASPARASTRRRTPRKGSALFPPPRSRCPRPAATSARSPCNCTAAWA
jgi:alkylation response protein AidB-like acyl-CoA dehydrogenase